MQKITPHLWFNTEAKEAAALYTSLFKNSRITSTRVITGTPSGDCDILSFDLAGQSFMAISAGPYFKLNPSISLLVACESNEEVDALWAELSKDGTVMMELGTYPFSPHYGWVEDRFGVSWQIMHMGDRPITQKITPTLMFTNQVYGKAKEAVELYTSLFKDSHVNYSMLYEENEGPDRHGTIKHTGFTLNGQEFAAMDSAYDHKFNFNEAFSFVVHCDTQEEIDYFWNALSAVPEAEQCGWLKDRFGVSWQIIPTLMQEMMSQATPEQMERITQAFLPMKKFDIETLKKAIA